MCKRQNNIFTDDKKLHKNEAKAMEWYIKEKEVEKFWNVSVRSETAVDMEVKR